MLYQVRLRLNTDVCPRVLLFLTAHVVAAVAIVDTMAKAFIDDHMPLTDDVRRMYANGFWQKSGLPNIILL
jgi:hypothetical protein